jgi:O-antigen ligase
VIVLLATMWRLAGSDARAFVPRSLVLTVVVAIVLLWLADTAARGDAGPTPSVVFTGIVFAAMATCAMLAHTGDRDGYEPWVALIAWGWLIAALVSTVIALAQHWGAEAMFGRFASVSPQHHAFANLRQRNHFATLACIGLASAVYLGVHARDVAMRVACAVAAAVVSLGLAASASRTGFVEVLVLLALWLAWRDAAWRRWAMLLAIGYGAAGALLLFAGGGHGVLGRLAGDAPDCQGRRVLWTTIARLIGERPWTGWGWDGLPLAVYGSPTQPHFCALVENAHNLPLHLAFAFGVPVALAVCAAVAFAIARVQPWKAGNAREQLGVPVLAVLLVHSLLEYPLWYGPFQMAFGLALGLVWRDGAMWRMPRAGIAVLAAGWLALGAYIAFDYARVSQPFLPFEARWRWRQDALVHAQRSWLFADLARHAQLMSMPLTPQTAARVYALSGEVMRFAPSQGVIDKRIVSARLLGLDAQAEEEARRLQRAYPSVLQ